MFYKVLYNLESTVSLFDAAENIAIGQSVGNPKVRNTRETPELWERAGCRIEGDVEWMKTVKAGQVTIAFPLANIDLATDGISQLLCQVMGGQLDIDSIRKCVVLDISFPPEVEKKYFLGPKYGIEGIRKFVGVEGKPLLGGIVKPKVGITTNVLLDIVKELVEGGVNFIKEDEIMANPIHAPLEERVPVITEYLKGKNVVYCFCINGDADVVLDRARFIASKGGNGIHVNFWSGLGIYKRLRELDLPLFIHYQKSGISILSDTRNPFHIEWTVICKLAGLAGVIISARGHSIRPDVGQGIELDVLAAVILGGTSLFGGKGKIYGVILGSLIIGVLNNGLVLLGMAPSLQLTIKGALIIAAVALGRR